jgi:uncharacterized protein YbaR (Trm112 family)
MSLCEISKTLSPFLKKSLIDSEKLNICCTLNCGGKGTLLKCVIPNCTNKAHLSCARNSEIAAYRGEITYTCANHSDLPLFCFCRCPYDESRDLIVCDNCGEWYHIECIDNVPEEEEDFHCKYCINNPDIVALKGCNLSKELRAAAMNRGWKLASIMREIESGVCLPIDILSLSTTLAHPMTLLQAETALKTLTSDALQDATSECEHAGTPDLYGLAPLFGAWADLLSRSISRCSSLETEAFSVIGGAVRWLGVGDFHDRGGEEPIRQMQDWINKCESCIPTPPSLDAVVELLGAFEWLRLRQEVSS